MNIPNLPTDNLYKLLALTGVIFVLIAFIYPGYKNQELKEEIITLSGEIKLSESSNDLIKNKLKEIKRKVSDLDELSGCNCVSIVNDTLIIRTRVISGKKELVELSAKIDQLITEWERLLMDYKNRLIEISNKQQLVRSKQDDLEIISEQIDIALPFAILIALIGFFSWYEKTQKFQDKVLKEQAYQFLSIDRCQSCGMQLSMKPKSSKGLFREFFSKPTDNPDDRFHSLDVESEHYTTYINIGVWKDLMDFEEAIGVLIPKRKPSTEVGKEDRELLELFNFEYKLRERIVMDIETIREGNWGVPNSDILPDASSI